MGLHVVHARHARPVGQWLQCATGTGLPGNQSYTSGGCTGGCSPNPQLMLGDSESLVAVELGRQNVARLGRRTGDPK
jgi:hypothetical protein